MGLVLVVDDTRDACELLARVVRRFGHTTLCAYSGPEALALLRTAMPDLILLDQMMPDMCGVDVLRTLRADERFRATPIVLVTAMSDVQTRAEAAAAGVTDYWTKPLNTLELSTRVAELIA